MYAEGYANAATMALLLLCVMQWLANADAVLGSDKIMGTLGGILPTISLMISMIMRLIPQFVRRGHAISNALNACTAARNPSTSMVSSNVFAEEAESAPVAKEAQKTERARHQKQRTEQNGANKPARRFSAIRFADHLRTVTTLMEWSMENSLETADSMHCRGWGANRKRTTFRRNHFRTYDAFALGALALLSVGTAAAAYTLMNGFGFFPAFHGSLGNPLAALYALALCFPLMLELLGKVRR